MKKCDIVLDATATHTRTKFVGIVSAHECTKYFGSLLLLRLLLFSIFSTTTCISCENNSDEMFIVDMRNEIRVNAVR